MASLLGKLYVSPASTEDTVRSLYDEVSEAVESNLVADTTGRNALYKLHVALGKIVNALDQGQEPGFGRRSVSSRATSAALEDRHPTEERTVVEADIKEEEEEEEVTVMPGQQDDSMVDELLSDEEL